MRQVTKYDHGIPKDTNVLSEKNLSLLKIHRVPRYAIRMSNLKISTRTQTGKLYEINHLSPKY